MKKIFSAISLGLICAFSTSTAFTSPKNDLENLVLATLEENSVSSGNKTAFSEQKSVSSILSKTESVAIPDNTDLIEIGVETNQLRFIRQTSSKPKTLKFKIATAKRGESTESTPFGQVFKVKLIVFNPAYAPTLETRREYFKKHRKKMKKLFLPGEKGNALGFVKFYFYDSDGKLSSFGGHTTDNPKSIGKRASHGCFRFEDKDGERLALLILIKDGHTEKEAGEIIRKAKMNHSASLPIKLKDGPSAVYMRE